MEKKKEQKSKKRFFLTKRDLRAIRWIAEQGIVTLDQVWRAVWKGESSKSSKYAEERLRGITQAGGLKRERVFGSGTSNYMATQKGITFLSGSGLDQSDWLRIPPVLRKHDLVQYRHRMGLNECRLYLRSQSAITHWVGERALVPYMNRYFKADTVSYIRKVVPDAYFQYEGTRWLLEFELTQKNKKKYEAKNKKYRDLYYYSFRGVIFIAANESIKKVLDKNLERFSFGVFTLDELRDGKVELFLERVKRADEAKQIESKRKNMQEIDMAEQSHARLKREFLALKKDYDHKSNQSEIARQSLQGFENSIIKFPGRRETLTSDFEKARDEANLAYKKQEELEKELKFLNERIERLKKISSDYE